MKFAILYIILVLIVAYALRASMPSEENKNHVLYKKFKKLHDSTGDPIYKKLSDHYHQEWVNETTDG